MKANKPFFDPWPAAWGGCVDHEARGALLTAYEAVRAREREFVDSPKRKRAFARVRSLAASLWAASGDLAEARIGEVHLRLWRRVTDDARREGRIPGVDLSDCILVTETFSVIAERDGLLDGPTSVDLLCGEDEEHGEWVVSELRRIVRRWISAPFRHTPLLDAEYGRRLIGWLAETCSDGDLLALACPPDDAMLADALDRVRTMPSEPLEVRDDPAGRVAGLQERHRRLFDEFRAMMRRMDMAVTFIRDPFLTALKDHAEADPFLTQLALPTLVRIDDAAHGLNDRGIDVSQSPRFRERLPEMLRAISVGDDFWYIVLFQILARHGAVAGEGFVRGVPDLLHALLAHPARLRRLPVPAGLDATRTAIARRILPAVRGLPAPMGDPEMDVTAPVPAPEALWRCAFRIASAQALAVSTVAGADQRTEGLRALYDEFVEPFPDAVALFLRKSHELGLRADAFLDAAVLEELRGGRLPSELESIADEAGEDLAFPPDAGPWLDEAVPAEPEAPAIRTWMYVHEPGNPASSMTEITLDSDRPEEDLGAFMRREGIPTVVKPSSVLHAIDHYLNLPDDVRAVMPHEDIGTMSWPKLKRGRLRILLRIDGDRLLFHIYARRDWAYRGPD
jgi:hypothetical protein